MMDKRIAYGCTLDEALKEAIKAMSDLSDSNKLRIRFFSIGNGLIHGELRPDGWRVYRPKKDPSEMHTDMSTVLGSFKEQAK